jgi:hypothetical protein
MAQLPLRRAASALLALTAGAILGACSEQSSPFAPVAPAAPAAAPNALLGLPIGGIVGGLLNTAGGLVQGIAGGLPLPKPLDATVFGSIKKDKKAAKDKVSHQLASAATLTCDVQVLAPQTRLIGPAGGVIQIGRHQLEIPAGALDGYVAITASVPFGSGSAIEFAPHGLQFNVPVQITLDYSGCTLPENSYRSVVYTDASAAGIVLDGMPSLDSASSHKIVALTDHFSGYIVAWGRN